MTQKDFYQRVLIIENPNTGFKELQLVLDDNDPVNPTRCISEKDFFDRIRLDDDGKIVVKIYKP